MFLQQHYHGKIQICWHLRHIFMATFPWKYTSDLKIYQIWIWHGNFSSTCWRNTSAKQKRNPGPLMWISNYKGEGRLDSCFLWRSLPLLNLLLYTKQKSKTPWITEATSQGIHGCFRYNHTGHILCNTRNPQHSQNWLWFLASPNFPQFSAASFCNKNAKSLTNFPRLRGNQNTMWGGEVESLFHGKWIPKSSESSHCTNALIV